ncbi:MAG: hypothetical protein AAGG44_07955 [Planctomycetota bacterium]
MSLHQRVVGLTTSILLIALAGCRPAPPTQSFGERQLQQVLEDRPEMRGVVATDSHLAKWIVNRFEGQGTGSRVHWNEREPLSGSAAEHLPAYEGYPANLSITKKDSTSPIDKWASLVYELQNLQETYRSDLFERALNGEFDAEEYAIECVRSEYSAVLATRKTLLRYPISGSIPTRDRWYAWVTSNLLPVDEYIAEVKSGGRLFKETNYRYFRDHFIEDLAPYLAQRDYLID